jgi:hypothetical protein
MSFKMKKFILLLLITLLFSCANGINYISENQDGNTGVNFTKGTW